LKKESRQPNENSQLQTTAEILVVGNELLNGTTLDTNSHWISKQLVKLGVLLTRKTTIRDDVKVISETLRECISRRPDWVFSIGGLGPTYDDMTVGGLAQALGKELYLDSTALQMLKENYARRRRMLRKPPRRMLKASQKMAMIPRGSTPLRNSVGSAPGVLAYSGSTCIVSFPGVPVEMKAIFKEILVPMIKSKASQTFVNAEKWLELVGVSESALSPIVERISAKHSPMIYVKSHPMGFEKGKSVIRVQLIMTATREANDEGLKKLLDSTELMKRVAARLGAEVRYVKSVR
jgi:nicotinamide-nucleotide amidase